MLHHPRLDLARGVGGKWLRLLRPRPQPGPERRRRPGRQLATNWARFLADVADELEAGNFAVDPKRESEEFQMIRPRRGTFMWNLKEWSAAKLAGQLLE